jgi:hypothetical protein
MADKRFEEVTFGTYYVREGAAGEFERTLPESWAVLHRLGFIAEGAPLLFRSVALPLRYIELAKWVPGVMGPAHEHPDLIPIWARLANLLEDPAPTLSGRALFFDEFIPVMLNVDA